MSLLVTGGYFDDCGDGVVFHVDLASCRAEVWGRWVPPTHLTVPGKGLAGGSRSGSSLFVAAHAAVVRWDLGRAAVDGLLHQPDFNDLHHVLATDDALYVANTGSDAVECFTSAGVFTQRWSLVPGWLHAGRMQGQDVQAGSAWDHPGWGGEAAAWSRASSEDRYYSSAAERAARPFHQQKVPDFLHPNHLTMTPQGPVVTCLRDGSLRGLGSPGARLYVDGFPHDGQVVDGWLWFTTIDGRVWKAPLPLGSGSPEIVADLVSLNRVGWCRGLLVRDDVIVVGLSEVRRDRLPRHRWADVDPSESMTGIVVLDRADGRGLGVVDLTDRARHAKVYSLVEVV